MRTATRLLTRAALGVAVSVWPALGPVAGGSLAHAADPTPDAGLEVYPASVTPGGEVTVNTLACGADGSASGNASAVGAGTFKLTPGTHEEVVVGTFKVPAAAAPGTYAIRATCDSGPEVAGDLVVTLTTSGKQQVPPKGHVKTGVGGALGPDPVQTAAGVAALAAAAAGGTWLLHRRASGDGI
ncbi:hypothetical protein [Streptomyces sp. NPDC002851]